MLIDILLISIIYYKNCEHMNYFRNVCVMANCIEDQDMRGSMRAHKWRVVLPLFKIIIIIIYLISWVTNYSLSLA